MVSISFTLRANRGIVVVCKGLVEPQFLSLAGSTSKITDSIHHVSVLLITSLPHKSCLA